MIKEGMMKLAPRFADKMVTILPGVDTSLFTASKRDLNLRRSFCPDDGLLVAYVGRVTSIKNPAVAIRAMRLVKAALGRKVSLAVIGPLGDGPDVSSISNYALRMEKDTKDWGLEDVVHFVGQLTHEKLARVLASCDVLVRPTPVEGIGAAVLEGLASGLPVLAADVYATRTMIKDEAVGHLFHWKDEKALAELIIRMATHPEERVEMSRRAREVSVRKHDWSAVARKIADVYASLI